MKRWMIIVGIAMLLVALAPAVQAEPGDEEPPEIVPVAMIGETGYPTLQDAVAAATEEDVITLVSDIVLTEPLVLDRSISLDGDGFTVTGSFVIDQSAKEDAPSAFEVELRDVTIVSEGAAVSQSASSYDRLVGLRIDGCTVRGSVSMGFASSVEIFDSVFGSEGLEYAVKVKASGVDGTVVSISGNTFTGSYTSAPVIVSQSDGNDGAMGRIQSLAISRNVYGAQSEYDLILGGASAYEAGFPLNMAIDSQTDIRLVSGTESVSMKTSSGTIYQSSYANGTVSLFLQGSAILSGSAGSSIDLVTIGDMVLTGFTGTCWFDNSRTNGLDSAGIGSWRLQVSTLGMGFKGTSGELLVLHGQFSVSDDLEIGGTLTIPEGSSLSSAALSRITEGTLINSGTMEVYGSITSDIVNHGTINAHRGAMITGNVRGNEIVYPVPAVVTMVLEGVAGEEISIVLEAEDGTVIKGIDGPSWAHLVGTTILCTPPEQGTFYITVQASSTEYTTSLQYKLEISSPPPVPAEKSGGWNLTVIMLVMVIAIVAIGLMFLKWNGRI